jgi:hypothetical protein
MKERRRPKVKRAERIEDDFGPGVEEERPSEEEAPKRGPIPGLACGGPACVLSPVTGLVTRFAAQLGPRHLRSLSHAAVSGIELMKALREFLDEEIAIAERAAGKREGAKRYEKISVE